MDYDRAEKESFYYNSLATSGEFSYSKLRRSRDLFRSWEKAHKTTLGATDENFKHAKTEWEKMLHRNIRLILPENSEYPELLKESFNPPLGLYVIGNLPKKNRMNFSIVGTRKPSEENANLAFRFGAELSKNNFVVVSGLAYGIDTEAHRGAISGGSESIAVLAHGLDTIYPSSNKPLAEKITRSNGALVSEYPLGTRAYPYNFIARNRVIAGLSSGILIIQASRKSGSLGTARFAMEANRDIFVTPGAATDKTFEGSHRLIQSGAALVTSPADVFETYGILANTVEKPDLPELDGVSVKIYEIIKSSAVSLEFDKISELTNLKVQNVSEAVTRLIFLKLIEETPRGFRLTP